MANLASPGYKHTTLINKILAPNEERIIEFKGLNRRAVVEEGEMSAMENLTSDNYPMLTPRKPRGKYKPDASILKPIQIIDRFEHIAMIAKDKSGYIGFYYDGKAVPTVIGLSEQSHMVAINTKICFFPQKSYIEIIYDGSLPMIGDFGYLEEKQVLTGAAVTISNEDAQITLPGIHKFGYDDAVDIFGTLSFTDADGNSQTYSCSVSCAVENVGAGLIVLPRETFIELTGEGATGIAFSGTIERSMPDLDIVIEWNNRLWGASNKDNHIYACKLGDPKNWHYYQGTSLDSYYAQQGTEGLWTGAAPYSAHLIFFKQNSMTRIYGTAPSNFQISNTHCYGVEEGSRKSVVVINDKVLYKSSIGIMAYDGGIPYCISEKFNMQFRNVVAGTEGTKYYASVQTQTGNELLVLDIDRGLWHREDKVRFRDCCTLDNKLYFIYYDFDELYCGNDVFCSDWLPCGGGNSPGSVTIINPVTPEENYGDIHWQAVFGPFDEYIENRKIYSKILMRLMPYSDSSVNVYISIDEKEWELVKAFDPVHTGGEFIPIIPRRCDRYSIKVEGTGNCAVKSLTRCVRKGTGGKL